MNKRKVVALAFVMLISLFMLTSCARGISSVVNRRGEGVKRTYSCSYSTAYNGCLRACKSLGIMIQSDEDQTGTIYGKTAGASTGQAIALGGYYGQWVGIYVTKISDTSTEVEVITKREAALDFYTGDWTDDIFQAIDMQVRK